MKTAAIIGNGPITNYSEILPLIQKHSYIIAVDGGLEHCKYLGLTPSLLIGDLDSVSESTLLHYPHLMTKKYPKDKDKTDLELGIDYSFENNIDKAFLFGVLGNRIDHSLMNINLLYKFPGKLYIESEFETIFAIKGNQTIQCEKGQTLSIIPLNEMTENVTTIGLKWNLNNFNFNDRTYSISNECLSSSFNITIGKGSLICCLIRKP